jgi:hypothetical protein
MSSPDSVPCPHCQTDLRRCGILEFGLVTFELELAWDGAIGSCSMRDEDEPRYDECREINWACRRCRGVLPTNPDDFVAGGP